MSDSSVRQPPSVPTVAFSFSHSLRGAAKLGEIKIYRIHDQSFAILSFADISTVLCRFPVRHVGLVPFSSKSENVSTSHSVAVEFEDASPQALLQVPLGGVLPDAARSRQKKEPVITAHARGDFALSLSKLCDRRRYSAPCCGVQQGVGANGNGIV